MYFQKIFYIINNYEKKTIFSKNLSNLKNKKFMYLILIFLFTLKKKYFLIIFLHLFFFLLFRQILFGIV
jgi:hypothetical protein